MHTGLFNLNKAGHPDCEYFRHVTAPSVAVSFSASVFTSLREEHRGGEPRGTEGVRKQEGRELPARLDGRRRKIAQR